MPTTAVPNVITDPGYLFWAPLLTAEPANTVAGSKFTDAWPGAWISWGASLDGSKFNYGVKLQPVMAAEFLDAIKWATVERAGSLAFALNDWTLTKWSKAVNGGVLTIVSGAGATQLNSLTPPAAGAETRAMLGWESLTNDARIIMYQCINGGDITSEFKKAPAQAAIPCTFNFEIPTAGIPWKMYSAGTARA